MKTATTIFLIIICAFSTFAQNYQDAMSRSIQAMFQSKEIEELKSIGQTFDRIGLKESSEYMPYYYAAYSYTSILFYNKDLSNEKRDSLLDVAQDYIDKALIVDVDESEIYALQALVYQMRIFTPSRGFKFSAKANEAIEKGLKQDDRNPRLYYLKGLNILHTPKMFGGGAAKALEYLEKADSLFKDNKKSYESNGSNSISTISPQWGEESNKSSLTLCREQL